MTFPCFPFSLSFFSSFFFLSFFLLSFVLFHVCSTIMCISVRNKGIQLNSILFAVRVFAVTQLCRFEYCTRFAVCICQAMSELLLVYCTNHNCYHRYEWVCAVRRDQNDLPGSDYSLQQVYPRLRQYDTFRLKVLPGHFFLFTQNPNLSMQIFSEMQVFRADVYCSSRSTGFSMVYMY